MVRIISQLKTQIADPVKFFDNVEAEGWKPAFLFFVSITLIISIVTPIINYLGIASTDISASYQAQIFAYNMLTNNLLQTYGLMAYIVEAALIFALAVPILLFLTLFLHLIYRLIGGQGSILNAWKAACYGVGPCLLGGFLPYISLFAAFYSLTMQFYIGPRELYKAKEGRAIIVLVVIIASSFIEMFVFGSTVGF